MISIVLADDHHIVRQGLRALLETESDFKVVGEAANGFEALDLAAREKPDVLIVDVMMPGMHGLEVVRQVTRRKPRTRVIMLSMYSSEAYVLEALRDGASAYVLKGARAEELVKAVREAVAGRHYLSPSLSQFALNAYVVKARTLSPDRYELLTTRERQILQLAAEGATSVSIGKRLSISPRTVEAHRANMMRKLGLRTQSDLVLYAVRRGLLPPEDPL
jgi:DNA-binding NarL/FixJ family response regulator